DKIIKIINVCDKKLIIHQKVLQDIYDLALYYVGADSISSCCEKIETNMGKLLLVVIWMTKLENVDNETDYIVDMRFLSLKNLYQAINMQSIDAEADNIIDYLEKIELDGAEASKKCVIDNIYHKPYGITDGFFEKYGNNFLSSNAFDFQTIQKDGYLTWQEQVLLDMISISIDGKKIVPIYKSGNENFEQVRARKMIEFSTWAESLPVREESFK
ncbi:MAG: hypothetical protein K6G72_02935, partial [Lachnospiraceae bacterium]|nr:hypothetical protein [Lachnospiraceae bacterium]